MADPSPSNPYDWTLHKPEVIVDTRLWAAGGECARGDVLERLARGNGVVVYGGRGMGKSVFVDQIAGRLGSRCDFVVAHIKDPVRCPTAASVIDELARQLGACGPVADARALLDAPRVGEAQVIILIDEVDALVRQMDGGMSVARRALDQLEAVRRDTGRLGILAAGGLALTRLGGPLGSAFVGRATEMYLVPLDGARITELAAPFARRGGPLAEDVVEAIATLSGGVPILVTYALQKLWALDRPTAGDVARELGAFPKVQRRCMEQMALAAVGEPSDPPGNALAVLRAIRASSAHPVPAKVLQDAMPAPSPTLDQVLPTLRAAGLIRWDGIDDEPTLDVRPSGSPILDRVPASAPSERPQSSLEERFDADLRYALALIHRASPDYRRQHGEVVPESTFRAAVFAVLTTRGWDAVPEGQQGAGRADILASHPRHPGERAVVELKIWPRNDYAAIHEQAASYRDGETRACAAVMIGHRASEEDGWAECYVRDCLAGVEFTPRPLSAPAPVAKARAEAPDGPGCPHVDHYLLLLARR